MRQIGAVEVRHSQLAEDVIEDRGRRLDRVVPLHHPCGFELGKGERIDELFERHAVLQTNRDRDGKVVHHRAEASTLFVHVEENLTEATVSIFARPEINLVSAHDRLLGIPLTALWHLFAVAAHDLFDDDLFDHLLGQHRSFFHWVAGFEDLCRLFVILNQRRSERLGQFRPITVERVRLNAEAPRQFVSLLAVLNRRIIRHVDRLRDRTRDERLRRSHHGDVAVNRQITLAFFAARVGAVKDVVVLFFQVRRTFQRHGATNVVVRSVDLCLREPKVTQQVKRRVVQFRRRNTEGFLAELFTQRPLVEYKADIKGRFQRGFDLVDLALAKAMTDQRGVVDRGGLTDRAMTNCIGDDLFDFGRAIAQRLQRGGNRAVDDFKVTAACKLLEFHEGKVRLNACSVTVHNKADGACRRDHRDLRVSVAVLFTQR